MIVRYLKIIYGKLMLSESILIEISNSNFRLRHITLSYSLSTSPEAFQWKLETQALPRANPLHNECQALFLRG